MSMSRKFKGIWIESAIWLRKDLSANEKVLWAEIDSLDDDEMGGCYASNKYLCEFLQVQERTLQMMLARLKRLGLLEQIKFDGRTRVLKAIHPNDKSSIDTSNPQNISYTDEEFCTPKGTLSDNIYSKENNKENTPESSQTSSSKPLHAKKSDFYFCHDTNQYIGITEEDKAAWRLLYPSIDLEKEIINSINWIRSQPVKGKKKLWRKFLTTTWFQNAEDKKFNIKAKAHQMGQSQDRRTKNRDGSPVEVDYGF